MNSLCWILMGAWLVVTAVVAQSDSYSDVDVWTESSEGVEQVTAQDDHGEETAEAGEELDVEQTEQLAGARSHGDDPHALFQQRAKPLKSIFMGIYKNYKSTYLGNKTAAEYKQRLRLKQMQRLGGAAPTELENTDKKETEKQENETAQDLRGHQEETKEKPQKRKRKRNHKVGAGGKRSKLPAAKVANSLPDRKLYNFGPGFDMGLDLSNDIVSVKLDAGNLQELMQGRWLSDKSEEGRGKKYEMVTKVLPLFILPFLIQSAIVPFLVTKLKLLLMKSILVGKLAIFLLIISAIKNSNKTMQTYEVAPSYWAGEPSRRSEFAAAASPVAATAAYNGYRVEGKPATWIN